MPDSFGFGGETSPQSICEGNCVRVFVFGFFENFKWPQCVEYVVSLEAKSHVLNSQRC